MEDTEVQEQWSPQKTYLIIESGIKSMEINDSIITLNFIMSIENKKYTIPLNLLKDAIEFYLEEKTLNRIIVT